MIPTVGPDDDRTRLKTDQPGVDVAEHGSEQGGDLGAGERGVGDPAHGERVGAELRGHLLRDAPREIAAEDRVGKDVGGQTLCPRGDEGGPPHPPP